MANTTGNSFFQNPSLSDTLLNNQVASGQTLSQEMSGEIDPMSKSDPLTEPRATGVFDTPNVNVNQDQFAPQTPNIAPEVSPSEDALDSPNTKATLTPGQTVGLAAASAGAGFMAGMENLKSQEAEAIANINRDHANFEFSHRLNRSARKISEMRSMINSIKNIGRQAPAAGSNVQTQQFTQSPTQGVLLND